MLGRGLPGEKEFSMVKKSARPRCTHTPVLKARVALAALREDKTMTELYIQMATGFVYVTAVVDVVTRVRQLRA